MLLKGMAIGLAIAAPVGPIGLLCLRRSLEQGRAAGLATGLGAASADAIYGAIAAFGLTAISGALVEQQLWLNLGGGIFLVYLGVRTALSAPTDAAGTPPVTGLLKAYTSTLLLTLTNPLTIMSFAAVYAGLGLNARGSAGAAVSVVSGVFLGSALWWLLLSSSASLLRGRLGPLALRRINLLSGGTIALFGLYALATLARHAG
jgi:threonine/homoserine/homoserine lactone efflux protein